MKPELRISIKDRHRNRNLKILLTRAPLDNRRFVVRMNVQPVSLTRVLTALRKALVKATPR
jgi:hypothetical protein